MVVVWAELWGGPCADAGTFHQFDVQHDGLVALGFDESGGADCPKLRRWSRRRFRRRVISRGHDGRDGGEWAGLAAREQAAREQATAPSAEQGSQQEDPKGGQKRELPRFGERSQQSLVHLGSDSRGWLSPSGVSPISCADGLEKPC